MNKCKLINACKNKKFNLIKPTLFSKDMQRSAQYHSYLLDLEKIKVEKNKKERE